MGVIGVSVRVTMRVNTGDVVRGSVGGMLVVMQGKF